MPEPENELHPKVRSLWRMGAGLWALAFAAAVIATAWIGNVPLIAIAAVVALPFVAIVPDAMYRRWRYEIRERDVYLSRGVLFHDMVVMPFDRIQFVETRQGPLDRHFNLAQIVIHTAGGKRAIPGLLPEDAERIRNQLAAIAGTLSV